MRVLVCGDRNWTDRDLIKLILSNLDGYRQEITIIQGEARGADSLAREVAFELGYLVEGYPAQWEQYGRAAGPIRNREMLDTEPDFVIAFHSNLEQSKGTKDCVEEARRRGIPVEVFVGEEE